jgi:threonine dehydrogenase-like Zn-dependent dehydrogenase
MMETASGAIMMRAAYLTARDTFTLREVPVPKPGAGEVRVRVAVCGVCSSEVHAVRAMQSPAPAGYDITAADAGPQPGRRLWQVRPVALDPANDASPFPMLMGHEVSGIVDAVGAGVRGVQVGQRVTTLTQHGYAEYALAPAANVIPLPDHIPLDLALGEPIACAANAAQRAGVRLGDTVALVGAGFMGLLALQFLLRLGAARVIVVEPRASARALAGNLGAVPVVDPAKENPVTSVLDATDGVGADVVVEATGGQHGLDLATNLTRTRGRLIIYGYHQGGPRTVEMQLWNLRGLDVVNAHQRSDDDYLTGMRAGLAMLGHGKLDMRQLVTHRYPLEQIGAAFALAEQCPEGFVKAIIVAQ